MKNRIKAGLTLLVLLASTTASAVEIQKQPQPSYEIIQSTNAQAAV